MATDLENLLARRSAVLTELVAINTDAAGGLPNSQASGIDHQGYKAGLYAELKEIDSLIDGLVASADGPWQEESQGFA